jgi:hypothetical protein
MRKPYRRDMFEDKLDRAFNGSSDILQRNEILKTQAKKKKHKNLDLIDHSAAFCLLMLVSNLEHCP